ncbi:MAG TPA: aromatic ring-hydroxylating dioxygenase subunit alpha [Sphingomonadaceae bacterium]|nr:aromatic ring-hydroxylating dioxygenase subunit alpha [Sphingomonadaceae bacterium]
MKWLRNAWYQAGWGAELKPGEPLARTILGEPILFYRTQDDSVAALFDRCPHRFAPLSAGRIGEGAVTCGYHGLAFGPDGACVRNPHGPITSRMRVQAYPVAERHTALWIWMGEPGLADVALVPDLSFVDETPEAARIAGYMPTKANYQLLADNILDLSHADYLHPTTLGGMMTEAKARSWEEEGKVVAEWLSEGCEPPPAFKAMVPEGKADIWTQVVWSAPALMVLGTAAKPAGIARTAEDEAFTLHNMVPETATTTHYFFCSTRRFLPHDADFSALLRQTLTQAFEREDKPMLEKQQARMGTDDLWSLEPILLSTDAPAVRARRRLDRLIAEEGMVRA